MKYLLPFNNFKELVLESLIKEEDIDEALVASGSNKWIKINKDQIDSSSLPNILKIVMNDLVKNSNGTITGFKVDPSDIGNEDEKHVFELFVFVSIPSKTVSRETRSLFYNDVLDKTYNLAEQFNNSKSKTFVATASPDKFNSITVKSKVIDLSKLSIDRIESYDISKETRMSLGVYKKIGKDTCELTGVVKFRLGEDFINNCFIKNANALLSSIFRTDDWRITIDDKTTFKDKVIETLKSKGLEESTLEYQVYKKLFEYNYNGSKLDLTKIGFTDDEVEFIVNSNISVVLSEIYVPWLIINGITEINGTPLEISSSVKAVSWPTSATNEFADFVIEYENSKTNVSAKGNHSGHTTSAIPVLINSYKADRENKTLFQKCAYIAFRANNDVKRTKPFICWCIAAKLYNLQFLAVNELYELYKKLNLVNSKNLQTILDSSKNPDSTLSKTIKKFTGFEYLKNGLITNGIISSKDAVAAWPFSLTHLCERYIVNQFNENESFKHEFYKNINAKLGTDDPNESFAQVHLIPNKKNIFNVKIKNIKIDKSNSRMRLSNKISFRAKTAPNPDKISSTSTISDYNFILKDASSGGQFIGIVYH